MGLKEMILPKKTWIYVECDVVYDLSIVCQVLQLDVTH